MRNGLIVAGVAAVLVVSGAIAYQQWRAAEPAPQASDAVAAAGTGAEAARGEDAAPAVMLAQGEQPQIHEDDRIMGSADAPVTIIEYASLTCPHCAEFHTQTLPDLKSTYIDEGTVRLVYRDFPLDRVALNASLLARCVPDDRYFAMLDVLFRTQSQWIDYSSNEKSVENLHQIGRTSGLDQAKIDACLADEAETDKIIAGIQAAQSEFNVGSTPTLIINGQVHAGALRFEQMQEILKDLLPKS